MTMRVSAEAIRATWAAKLAYQRRHSKFAQETRGVAIGRFLVSAFRLHVADWNVIRGLVSAVAGE
jgi:hypothetical protein